MADSNRGLLITFEGGEGGGKSTQVALLKEALTKQGQNVIALREPGGTPVSEQIREVVLSTKNQGICFESEVLLFQAARAQVTNELIIPSLQAGKMVLMDRFRDSSVVYQGIVRGFGKDMIENLNDISTQKTYPNFTFLLDIDAKEGLHRSIASGKGNRFEDEPLDFHQKVRNGYLELAKADTKGRWFVIDAAQTVEAVHQQILTMVLKKLANP